VNWHLTGPETASVKRCRRIECGRGIVAWRTYCCRGCKRYHTAGYDESAIDSHSDGCHDRAAL
jgi:hypothetical protein